MSCASKRKQTTDLAVLKSVKWNVVIGDVHRAKRISYGFDYELSVIKLKHIKAGCPPKFVTSVINNCFAEKEYP